MKIDLKGHAFSRVLSLAAGLFILLTSGCKSVPAEPSPVTPQEIDAHIRFLSDDLLEGRAVGSRGIALAALYQENYFRGLGLEPMFGGSYRQAFDLKGCTPDPSAACDIIGPQGKPILPAPLARIHEDFVLKSQREDCPQSVEGEMIYCGYLIQAPERNWDDFKGLDVKGKVLLCEINEPGNVPGGIFDGEDMTYYGRWTYKFEKAAELGAAGVLIIHNAKGAAYGWEVVRNGWSRESFFLSDLPQTLFFQGWISGPAADNLFQAAGLDRKEIAGRAEKEDFRPVALGLRARVRQKPKFRLMPAENVAAVLRGDSNRGEDRWIVISAHYDHLGMDETLAGDQVYNGAVDNNSATAALLALARSYAQSSPSARPKANLVFAAVTAEEQVLLGSDYFARRLPFPASHVLADINLEMTNVWGETEDVFAIGAKHSDLDEICRRAAEKIGLQYIPDQLGKLGFFFRSDQLSFARAGIPAAWLHHGFTSRGADKAFIQRKFDDYQKLKYHKVIDQIEPDWDYRGTIQIIRWAREIIRSLDTSASLPQFKETSSFRRK